MPKTYIINIDYNYPFNLKQSNKFPDKCIIKIVRSLALNEISKQFYNKITFAQSLRNKNLIKVEQVKQVHNSQLQIFYEFVEAANVKKNPQFWDTLLPQIQTFVNYLANIGIRLKLQADKICVNSHGILKYYMGLEFQLSQEQTQENYLDSYYENQIQQFKSRYIITKDQEKLKLQPYKQKNNPKNWDDNYKNINRLNQKSKSLAQKYRKASFITLPSNIPNLFTLNNQLSKIKNSVRQISQYQYKADMDENRQTHLYEEQYHETQKYYKSKSPPSPSAQSPSILRQQSHALSPTQTNHSPMKHQIRKYSDDTRQFMISNRKLSAKYSDFRVDRSNYCSNTKSRIEQMKYQEYIQITKSDKNYLNDFLSVLEDDFSVNINMNAKQPQSLPQTHKTLAIEAQQPSSLGQVPSNSFINNTKLQSNNLSNNSQAAVLKQKAQQSIKNSLKIIQKVKGIC